MRQEAPRNPGPALGEERRAGAWPWEPGDKEEPARALKGSRTRPPPTAPLWREGYCELKAMDGKQIREKLSAPPNLPEHGT